MALFETIRSKIDTNNTNTFVNVISGPAVIKGIYVTNTKDTDASLVKIGIGPASGVSNDDDITQWILTPVAVPAHGQGANKDLITLKNDEAIYIFSDTEGIQIAILKIEV